MDKSITLIRDVLTCVSPHERPVSGPETLPANRHAVLAALLEPDELGTSVAALRVVAAAVLVWSINPAAEPAWVRQVLLNSADSHEIEDLPDPIRCLNIDRALQLARTAVVEAALADTALTYEEIQGAVGFPTDVLDRALEFMLSQRKLLTTQDPTRKPLYRRRSQS